MDSLTKLSNLIFDLFVANPYAIAIQQPNGIYYTKYLSYDASIIEGMIKTNGSAGCYQQGFRSGKIKWICMDFDCKNKDNPPIDKLLAFLLNSFLPKLDALKIHYLTEFSGRRGIHVWVLFNESISKQLGYSIIHELVCDLDYDTDMFGLDLFPSTDDSSKNKVGKQVKFPLSCHRNGGRSFFFRWNIALRKVREIRCRPKRNCRIKACCRRTLHL